MTLNHHIGLCTKDRFGMKDTSGQALVESALVIPLMLFLILGIIQLAMVQHAKIMAEYAAFNAARAGIVWNADRYIMENAATISLIPTNESVLQDGDFQNLEGVAQTVVNPVQLMRRILQRALIYQVNQTLPAAVGFILSPVRNLFSSTANQNINAQDNWFVQQGTRVVRGTASAARNVLNSGADMVEEVALASAEKYASTELGEALGVDGSERMVRVDILSPNQGFVGLGQAGLREGNAFDTSNLINTVYTIMAIKGDVSAAMAGDINRFVATGVYGHFGHSQEIDFDDFLKASGNKLTIRVRYMYVMRIPFANWVINSAWFAGQAGQMLYGAVWNPQMTAGATGFADVNPYTRPRAARTTSTQSGVNEADFNALATMADCGVYALPITASYSMRMQSNPYRRSILLP